MLSHRAFAAALALALFAALPCFGQGKTYFVSPDGSDGNPGTREEPLATIRRAVLQAEGQPEPAEVVVRGGTHFLERTVWVRRSDKECRLTIRAAEGETPVIDGSIPLADAEPLEGVPGVYIVKGEFFSDEPPTMWEEETGQHFTKLACLEAVRVTDYSSTVLDEETLAFRGRDGMSPAEADIRMSQPGVMYGFQILRDNVTLRGLEFRNFVSRRLASPVVIGGTGMVTGGRRGRAREGTFTANAVIESCTARNSYVGFRVWINGLNARIVGNRTRNCVTGTWVSGIDTLIEGNEFVNDPDFHSHKLRWDREFDRRGISFYHGPEDAVMRRNLIANFRTGIFSKGSPGEYVIENNTVVNVQVALAPDPGFRATRNIFTGIHTPFSERRGTEGAIDHNVFWAARNLARAIRDGSRGGGPNNVFADPMFASPARGDYHLLPGSPALQVEGGEYAGAFPPVPDGYQGPPNLRARLVRERNQVARNPYPPSGVEADSAYVSRRRTVEAELEVVAVAPAATTRFRVNDGPAEERAFQETDAFELPDEDGLHTLRLQVQDANGHWSDEAVLHVTLSREGVRFVGEPEAVSNRYGALFLFETDQHAWGRLEVREGDEWTEVADTRGLSGYRDTSALPLFVEGLAPDTPHRYRLTATAALGSAVKEGTFTLSGPPKIMYVSTDGEDAIGRGEREAPYRSIQYALDRALPGDRVRIMPGVYFEELILYHGGTAERPLTVEGLYPNTVVLDGLNETETMLNVRNAPHVVLRNLNFRWYRSSAINVSGSEGVRVTGCRFQNLYWVGGAGVTCRTLNFSNSPGFTVDHSIFTRTRYGISALNSPGGRILHNTATANAVTHILWRGDPEDDIVIKYNSLNWNGNQMINIGLPQETVRERTEIDFNNYGTTFRRPEGTPRGGDETVLYGRSLERPFPYLPTNREFIVAAQTFANMEGWLEYSGQDSNSIFADPKWIDPRAGRFDVAADSPNLLPDGKVIGALGYLGEDPNMKPEAVVAAPYPGQEIRGAFAVEAHASDFDGTVEKVQFFAGETLLGEAAAPPYRAEGVSLPPGRHVITARAIDDRGGAGVSDEVDIVVAE